MMAEENKKISKIRIELLCRKKINFMMFAFHVKTQVVQGNPTEFWLRFTNLGNEPTPALTVSDFNFTGLADNLNTRSNNSLMISSLNPEESCEKYLDCFAIKFKGSAWITLKLAPVDDSYNIQTFQYNKKLNDIDEPVERLNEWVNSEHVQGELEVLQHNTNRLILALTAVTVLQSMFDIRQAIRYLFHLLIATIHLVAGFFSAII
jgi:hypothetical protein